MPDALVFDLDGTLWDASRATAVAWNNILVTEGIDYREITPDDVRAVTGRPHDEAIRLALPGITEAQFRVVCDRTTVEDGEAIERLGGDLYPGVRDGLVALAKEMAQFIVSNCQQGYVELFFRQSGLAGCFRDFECWGNTGRPKAENLRSVLDRNGIRAAVMVGDTRSDESAARACGVPFALVTYGFGDAEAPDFRFDSFSDLVREFSPKLDRR